MKVSLIDPVGGHGGMDYYDYGLAMGLAANHLIVDYYTCNKTNERTYKNIRTEKVFKDVWEKKGIVKLYFYLLGYLKAFLLAKKNKSKVLHFQFFGLKLLNLIVLLISCFFTQKKVVTLHDIESFHKPGSKFVTLLCLKLIDGIIFHNHFSKNEFEKKFNFKGLTTIIPHGNYLPFVTPKKLNKSGDIINLLFFGQLKKVKGIDTLLHAMKEVVKKSNQFHLTIAGRPWKTEAKEYIEKIKELGLQKHVTTLFKYIKDEDVDKLYSKSSIIILPYKKIYQSGVLLLTLSYGRTVIASNLPPFKEIISDGENGFIFSSEDCISLSNCILKLNHKLISEVTERSNKLISYNYNWENIGGLTIKFYNSL